VLARRTLVGAAALGVLAAAPGAHAAEKDKSPRQRVDRVVSDSYGGQITFDSKDRPHAAATSGFQKELTPSGKVVARKSLGKASSEGGPRAAAGGYTCVTNHGRKGFVIYKPQPLETNVDAYYERFVYYLYKQNKARKVYNPSVGRKVLMKQWESCFVGGAQTKGGNRLSRVVSSVTMGGHDRLIGWKWGKGKEVSEAKASLSFAVPVGPVTVSGSVDVYPTYTTTGGQGPDKDAPDSWKSTVHNQVNAIWEGSSTFRWQGSTHFQGNVGHALWEVPQSLRTQPITYSMNVRRFCGHPAGIGCS
jgi:hypothetical protein